MVKCQQFSGGSEDEMPNGNTSCSAEASSGALEMNGDASKNVFVNGSYSDKESINEIPEINGHADMKSAKEVATVNGTYSNTVLVNKVQAVNGHYEKSAKKVPTVNGNSSNDALVNDIQHINGHCDKMSAKIIPTGMLSNAVLASDVLTANRTCDEAPAEEVPIKNVKDLLHLSIPPENGSSSSVHTSDSLGSEENSIDNQNDFIEVVNKKKLNKNRSKNHRKKPSPNLPPGLSTESIRRDNGNDKNCREKTSPSHLSQKPPNRNFAAVRSSEKSYSSVLANGQTGNSLLRNSGQNIFSDTQRIIKCTKSNTSESNCTLSGTSTSVDQLSTELTKSAVINETSGASYKQSNLSTQIEMTNVSAQTDICSPNEISQSQKECLSSQEEIIHKSVKVSSGCEEISDESSKSASCDSVVSDDSGRGDSELTYDGMNPYCCEFPKEKTSQLIGRGGSFKKVIERMSGVELWVNQHGYDNDLSIVCLTGTGAQIEKAKELIKGRFPHATLRQWIGCNPINPALSETYLPTLPEGTDFMGVASSICNPNFFWVQQYGHPHLYALDDLERRMSDHFNTVTDAPAIDNPTIGSVIAVPGVIDGDNVRWIRGSIINIIPEDGNVVVRYLDHGGDRLVPISNIRPMRHDFFSMPFFAAQCCLYDILPTGGVWSEEALAEFTRLCNSSTCPPRVRVMCKTPDYYFVNMYGYDSEMNALVDIAAHLITKGFGVRPCLPATEFPSGLL